jgi:hypothetical protein
MVRAFQCLDIDMHLLLPPHKHQLLPDDSDVVEDSATRCALCFTHFLAARV